MPSCNPLVSVVMPVYHSDRFLLESITSIQKQTFSDFEFIIICDDPSDTTKDIIGHFQQDDDRIRVVYRQSRGLVSSLNKGISLATGKYIARMDADDLSYSERLEKQVVFMEEHPDCSLVATKVELIDNSGNFIGHWETDFQADTSAKIQKILPRENCIAHPTVLIRRTVMEMYYYNPTQKNGEDYDLWLRMVSDNHILCKIPEIMLKLRIHPFSITSSRRIESPGSDILRCKIRYLIAQLRRRKVTIFNGMVFFYLIIDCMKYPVIYIRSKIRTSFHMR